MQPDERVDLSPLLRSLSDLDKRLERKSLQIYLRELLSWNPSLGLISKREPERTAVKLIRLSVDLWDFLMGERDLICYPDPIRVVDIGSGGGIPGILWKLLDPNLSMVLVERKERKAIFLERVIRQLSMKNVEVVALDANLLSSREPYRRAFRVAVMLAVSPPEEMARTVEPLLSSPGYFCTVRGSREKIIEDVLGEGLRFRRAVAFDEGTFVLYEKPEPRMGGS